MLAACAFDGRGNERRVAFLTVLEKDAAQLLAGPCVDDLIGRQRVVPIHPHVERRVGHIGEAAFAVVQLRRGNAEIEQHSVHLGDVQGIQYFAKVGEVPVYQRDLVHMFLQPLPRRVQRDRVAVDADEASAGQPPADLERMARAAERTIQINAVRADIQKLDGLVQENGFM